ncbi:MAG: ABC transporter permease [Clostridiales bacterium]|nr:ABC transporter permease [Clostridiales bacterium]
MRGRAKGILGAALALAGALLMALAAVKLYALPNIVEYAVLAPQPARAQADGGEEKKENAALAALIERLAGEAAALSESVDRLDLSGEAGAVEVSAGGAAEKARLTAVGEFYFVLNFAPIADGRLFHPEELKRGAAAAVLSDALAFKLFGGLHVEGRRLTVGGAEYSVIGVVREGREAQRPGIYHIYLPIAQVAKGDIALSTLALSGRPLVGQGAIAAFREAGERWQPGGNALSAERERTYALIPARACATLTGMALIAWLARRARARFAVAIAAFRADLRLRYARQAIWPLLGRSACALVAFAALIGGAVALMWFMLQPVRVFTEWVPTNLVDWDAVSGAFWRAREAASLPIEVRTPLAVRARFFGSVANLGALVALAGAALYLGRRRAE